MSKLLYWECNKATWDHIRRMMAPHAASMHQLSMNGIEIRLNEQAAPGWHPVYDGEVPRWGPCCPQEKRSMAGGCIMCGDPCI